MRVLEPFWRARWPSGRRQVCVPVLGPAPACCVVLGELLTSLGLSILLRKTSVTLVLAVPDLTEGLGSPLSEWILFIECSQWAKPFHAHHS